MAVSLFCAANERDEPLRLDCLNDTLMTNLRQCAYTARVQF